MKISYILIMLFSTQMVLSQVNDTITTKSGLKYFFTHKGEGKAIDSGAVVIQHYTVWLSNGDKLDSSRDRNKPFASEHPSNRLIKGTNESLSLMNVGDRGKFIFPYYLAYGEKGIDSVIPPKETLTFDIEVLDTKKWSLDKELRKVLYTNYKVDSIPKVSETISKYKELKKNGFDDIYTDEEVLNTIGYNLLKIDFVKEALEIFKLNVAAYPNSENPYDSLGEAYMLLGNKELAILNYKKSLELDPENKSALKMLEKLKE